VEIIVAAPRSLYDTRTSFGERGRSFDDRMGRSLSVSRWERRSENISGGVSLARLFPSSENQAPIRRFSFVEVENR